MDTHIRVYKAHMCTHTLAHAHAHVHAHAHTRTRKWYRKTIYTTDVKKNDIYDHHYTFCHHRHVKGYNRITCVYCIHNGTLSMFCNDVLFLSSVQSWRNISSKHLGENSWSLYFSKYTRICSDQTAKNTWLSCSPHETEVQWTDSGDRTHERNTSK